MATAGPFIYIHVEVGGGWKPKATAGPYIYTHVEVEDGWVSRASLAAMPFSIEQLLIR